MQCTMGSSCSSRGADPSPSSSDSLTLAPLGSLLQGRIGKGGGGWGVRWRLVPNVPPPLFTHPSETNRQEGSRPPQSSHWLSRRDSGADKQASDNPTEFPFSSECSAASRVPEPGDTHEQDRSFRRYFLH